MYISFVITLIKIIPFSKAILSQVAEYGHHPVIIQEVASSFDKHAFPLKRQGRRVATSLDLTSSGRRVRSIR